MKVDLSILVCFFTLVNCNQDCKWGQYSCGDKCQLLSTPCEGLCTDYRVLIDNICETSWNTWDCNGTIQYLNKTCNRQCPKHRCLSEDGLSCSKYVCEESRKTWECNGKHLLLSTPCEGLCGKDMVLIDNICEGSWKTWDCNATIMYLNETCNRQCPKNRCLGEDGLSCKKAPNGYYSCGDKCQLWRKPCNGECLKPLQLVEGLCNYNLRQSEIWQCDGKQQFRKTPCHGKCPNNSTLEMGSCFAEDEFWVCDNVKQTISTPCIGLCSYTTKKEYPLWYNRYDRIYQTDYVNCEDKCLLREFAWKCNGRCISRGKPCDGNFYSYFARIHISKDGEYMNACGTCDSGGTRPFYTSAVTSQTAIQIDSEPGDLLHLTSSELPSQSRYFNISMGVYQKSKVIYNKFPVYYHRNGAYYIFVDNQGFWAISNGIGFEASTFYRNDIKPTPEQPPSSGWGYRNSIGGNWQEDPGLQLVVQVLVSGICPPKYCPRGERCCEVVWGGPNRGYICPTNC